MCVFGGRGGGGNDDGGVGPNERERKRKRELEKNQSAASSFSFQSRVESRAGQSSARRPRSITCSRRRQSSGSVGIRIAASRSFRRPLHRLDSTRRVSVNCLRSSPLLWWYALARTNALKLLITLNLQVNTLTESSRVGRSVGWFKGCVCVCVWRTHQQKEEERNEQDARSSGFCWARRGYKKKIAFQRD